MSYQIIIHADDFGISREMTDKMLECCDSRVLSSISLVPNGPAFDYAISELKKRASSLRLSVHINLLEGNSISPANEINRIVDGDGRFYHSFPGLWMKYVLSNRLDKNILKQQVKREMKAQILKVNNALGEDSEINVDSHNHYHMIPFVFDALLELAQELRINYIRIPSEKYFWCLKNWSSTKKYFSSNMIKHFLLNILSRGCKKKCAQLSVGYPQHFIGVLFTGSMTKNAVESALDSINDQARKSGIVEILFHPGRAGKDELVEWVQKKQFNDYYCSPLRDAEFNELTDPAFKHLIESATKTL